MAHGSSSLPIRTLKPGRFLPGFFCTQTLIKGLANRGLGLFRCRKGVFCTRVAVFEGFRCRKRVFCT